MEKPLQFSMRRMFAAMVLFCAMAWLLSIAGRPCEYLIVGIDRYFSLAGAMVCGMAAVGTITEERIANIVRSLAFLATILLMYGLLLIRAHPEFDHTVFLR